MGECIGVGRADLVLDNIVLEIKANKQSPKATSAQLQKYLVSLSQAEKKVYHGVVVNFNQKTGLVDIYHDELRGHKESELFKRSLHFKSGDGIDVLESLRFKRKRT
jgi:CRISPR/Cas system-associated exonuclease Cas4 (RecB family)